MSPDEGLFGRCSYDEGLAWYFFFHGEFCWIIRYTSLLSFRNFSNISIQNFSFFKFFQFDEFPGVGFYRSSKCKRFGFNNALYLLERFRMPTV